MDDYELLATEIFQQLSQEERLIVHDLIKSLLQKQAPVSAQPGTVAEAAES